MVKDESTLKLLRRIKQSKMIEGDGKQFMEYLEDLSKENYEAFKIHGAEMNDIHKGYAQCVDFLLECFANCEKEPNITEQHQLGSMA